MRSLAFVLVALAALSSASCSSSSSSRAKRMHRETWGALARTPQVGWFCGFRAQPENHMQAGRYEGDVTWFNEHVTRGTAACEPLGLLRCAVDCTAHGPGAPDPSTGYLGFVCRTADLYCQPYVRAATAPPSEWALDLRLP